MAKTTGLDREGARFSNRRDKVPPSPPSVTAEQFQEHVGNGQATVDEAIQLLDWHVQRLLVLGCNCTENSL